MVNYGIQFWSDDDFIIEDGKLKANYGNRPAIIDIVKKVREDGYRGPLLLRFPHLIHKQIQQLFGAFNRAIKHEHYEGKFKAVFPLKVNQFPNFVLPLVQYAQHFDYGLEAGSKAELVLAMAHARLGAPITVNGFKDREMVALGFIAAAMGHDITLTIEGLGELETIIEIAK
ncbi:MAG: arginine decarboxylase, partial [Helicobacter sp.]|nr:arginine decarboxylase [Helicobacter sp.]